jgi:hypothetical protein
VAVMYHGSAAAADLDVPTLVSSALLAALYLVVIAASARVRCSSDSETSKVTHWFTAACICGSVFRAFYFGIPYTVWADAEGAVPLEFTRGWAMNGVQFLCVKLGGG